MRGAVTHSFLPMMLVTMLLGAGPAWAQITGGWLANPRHASSVEDFQYQVQSDVYRLRLEPDTAHWRLASRPAAPAIAFVPGPQWVVRIGNQEFHPASIMATPGRNPARRWQDLRLVMAGQYLHQFELFDMPFTPAPSSGRQLDSHFKFSCWPDGIDLNWELESPTLLEDFRWGFRLPLDSVTSVSLRRDSRHPWTALEAYQAPDAEAVSYGIDGGGAITIQAGDSVGWLMEKSASYLDLYRGVTTHSPHVPVTARLWIQVEHEAEARIPESNPVALSVAGDYPTPAWDPIGRTFHVPLTNSLELWTSESRRLTLLNRGSTTQSVNLSFDNELPAKTPNRDLNLHGLTGFLLDAETSQPLGATFQISKNWHSVPIWSRAMTRLSLSPGATRNLVFYKINANWNGMPAVSLAQLCLIGWGGYQQWDQVAVGSFGEQICFDPYVGLERSFVDDIRPLLVWGLGPEKQKYSWTENVGGADFFTLETTDSLTRRETFFAATRQAGNAPPYRFIPRPDPLPGPSWAVHRKVGPVLIEAEYSPQFVREGVNSRIHAYVAQADDYFRVLFHVRHDFARPLKFERLGFFQAGAEHYNDNINQVAAHGTLAGCTEVFHPSVGTGTASRRGVPFSGDQPWFAFLGAQPENDASPHACWPNRVITLRAWNARIGGASADPHFSVFGTSNQIPSALFELGPPASINAMQPGDFIDAWIELAVIPQRAEDYYGPNERMRERLAQWPDDWRMARSVAADGHFALSVTGGELLNTILPQIRATSRQLTFTVERGTGWMPLVLQDLKPSDQLRLERLAGNGWRTLDAPERLTHQRDEQANGMQSASWCLWLDEGSKVFRITFEH